MRYLEVRRHTMRAKPGPHVTQAGVDLARRVGEGLGPFQRVITSTLPRAFETAIAMGFAVDEQIESMSTYSDAVDAEMPAADSFESFAKAVKKGKAAADYAHSQAKLWHAIAKALPENGAALIISHGNIVELSAVAALPDVDHRQWGESVGYCEGIRAYFDGEAFVRAEILRVPQPK